MSSAASPTIEWRDGTREMLAHSVGTLNDFLRQAKCELYDLVDANDSASRAVVHVVIGNEAADADSIVSSLVYAHFKHAHRDSTHVLIPVLPIPRDELALRCDVSALFSELRVDLDALTFVDEFPWQHAAFSAGAGVQLRLTLLDHNALSTKRMTAPSDVASAETSREIGEVVEILDHHMDLGKHPAAPVREIAFADGQALVASNCTLVAEKLLASDPAHRRDSAVFSLHATLLLAVMALDSVNFSPSAKKVTARDVAVAAALEPAAFASKEALFTWLQAEKFSATHWDAFSVRDCLQCDYKEFELPVAAGHGVYGVSAILIDAARFGAKAASGDALVAQLEAFARANHVAFVLVMTMFITPDGARNRQLLFFTPSGGDAALVARCVSFLREDASLALEPLAPPHGDARLQTFTQRNVGASRKQVVPLLQRALDNTSL